MNVSNPQPFHLNESELPSSSDVELADGPQPLQLIITRPHELDSCPFWVCLYRLGQATPQNLFNVPTIDGIFRLLSEEGLKEKQPLMLSENTEGKSPRQFYLIPDHICRSHPERIRDLIVTTLEALGPPKVGLYFSSQKLGIKFVTDVIEEISLGVSFLRTKEVYLYTGEIGLNPLLNAALRIKSRLEGRREVFVYH